MSKEYVQRRTAGEGFSIRPSERVMRARDSLPIQQTQAQTAADGPAARGCGGYPPDQQTNRDKWIYRAIVAPMTKSEIFQASGLSKSTVERGLASLMDSKRIMFADGRYTRVAGAGWSEAELKDIPFPGRAPYNGAGARAKVADKDVLAPMVGDKMIPQDTLPSYKKAFEDLSRLHYGVKEIDDSIKAMVDVLRARISSVRYECPLCSRAIEVNVTRCHCKKCGWTIDVGDIERALKLAKYVDRE